MSSKWGKIISPDPKSKNKTLTHSRETNLYPPPPTYMSDLGKRSLDRHMIQLNGWPVNGPYTSFDGRMPNLIIPTRNNRDDLPRGQ